MSNFAIIIGIDAYANEDWNLSAAVEDALKFLAWAQGLGGVPADETHTRLLLSTAKPDVTAIPHQPATRANIAQALLDFADGAGKDGERFFFYYAGHGVSAPGAAAGGPAEPVIIPHDVQSFRRDAAMMIPFSGIIPQLSSVSPPEQFFFIDACRDFAIEDYRPPIGSSPLRWAPPLTGETQRSAQYVLYATSPGQRAYETGRGAFGQALLSGLRGEGAAKVWTQASARYEVRFRTLVPFVRGRVEAAIKRLAGPDAARYIQLPEREVLGGGTDTDPLLALLDPRTSEIEKISIGVRVTPKAAREKGRVRVVYFQPGGKEEQIMVQPPPALALPARFELSPGEYLFVAEAEQFQEQRLPYAAYEPGVLDFKLEPKLPSLEDAPVFEFALGLVDSHNVTGSLEVSSADRAVVIVVRDSQRQIVPNGVGIGVLNLPSLEPGIYRVQPLLPEGTIAEQTVEVRAGETTTVPLSLEPARLQLGTDQEHMLQDRGIVPTVDGYVSPSELLGPIADAKLASLLGFAAFAALWPDATHFHRLRSFGVTPMLNVPQGKAGLLVLVGAAGDQPVPGINHAQFVGSGHMVARTMANDVIDEGGFEPLAGFAAAAQRQVPINVGPLTLEISLPELARTHYALVGLPNRVTVLILVAAEGGGFEIQQYLLPLPRRTLPIEEALLSDPSNIRLLELAQRYYASGTVFPVGENLGALLDGKWLDPLLGCVAGYSLIRQGMADEFVGQPNPKASATTLEPSAMRNMLKFFGDLPDSHVLAGLAEPQNRAKHYASALRRGLPLFADGFRALYGWYQAEADALPEALAEAGSGLLPSSVWTAWIQPLRFLPTSNLPRDLQQELQKTVSAFVEYLTNIGFLPPTERVSVDTSKDYPNNASYDPGDKTIRIGLELARDADVALREFAHHELVMMLPEGIGFGDLSPAAMSVESGLADYYVCSFTDDPRVAEIWAPIGLDKPFVRNLDNALSFVAKPPDQRVIYQLDGEIWGGAFWELRTLLGKERSDRLLIAAWSAQAKPDLKRLKPADFARRILAAVKADGGPDVAKQVRERLTQRGL